MVCFFLDVFWNDIEWFDGGKGWDEYVVVVFLEWYFDVVFDGVVNDWWGVLYYGFFICEYMDILEIILELWELICGFGYFFGFN